MTVASASASIHRNTPPEGNRGVLIAFLILITMFAISTLGAWLLSGLTTAIIPSAPLYLIVVYALIILIILMPIVARSFPWIINWYYVLPSLVFLAAFTVLPIVLTINYAFTNYSGQNSGNPDSASRTDAKLDNKRQLVSISALPEEQNMAQYLNCKAQNCAGDTVILYDQDAYQPVKAKMLSVAGKTISLAKPVPITFDFAYVTRLNRIQYIGLANFREIFARATRALWPVFAWTVIFAFFTVVLNAIVGLILGILLFNKRLKGRNIYRTLLFLPWAIPAVISVQMWVALLNQQFGIVNKTLGLLGLAAVPWLGNPLWAKLSILLVNLWLGFPYMMTATISALGTINEDLYEAASIDGASRWQQIINITLPLLRNSFTPLLLSAFAFNFNNFGIIYLLTKGLPAQATQESTAGATDILLSWGYKTAFAGEGGQNYGLASAIAVIIFFLTLAISLINFKAAGVFEEARK